MRRDVRAGRKQVGSDQRDGIHLNVYRPVLPRENGVFLSSRAPGLAADSTALAVVTASRPELQV